MHSTRTGVGSARTRRACVVAPLAKEGIKKGAAPFCTHPRCQRAEYGAHAAGATPGGDSSLFLDLSSISIATPPGRRQATLVAVPLTAHLALATAPGLAAHVRRAKILFPAVSRSSSPSHSRVSGALSVHARTPDLTRHDDCVDPLPSHATEQTHTTYIPATPRHDINMTYS